jgi:hypothetical protein
MTGKKLFRAGLCLVAVGGGAIVLHGEPAPIAVAPAAPCLDGSCVPRRLTNGYYQTKWRRWPVEHPAAARPGVREGISAPPVELPEREQEAAIPPGAFAAPSPSDQQPADSDFPPSRSTAPTAPPPSGTPPRDRPEADLPPELRGSPLPRTDGPMRGYPSWTPRTPAITASMKKDPVSQLPRNDASRQHGEEPHAQSSLVPGALPAAAPSARPIATPPRKLLKETTDEQARWHGRATQLAQGSLNEAHDLKAAKWNALSQMPDSSAHSDHHASYHDKHQARGHIHPSEEFALQSALPNAISRSPGPLKEYRESATSQSRLNMPASIGEPSSSRVMQASASSMVREPASNVAAVLAVRAEGPSLPLDRPVRNPLRGTRIALDRAGDSGPANSERGKTGAMEPSSPAAGIPENPLR